MQHPQRHIIQTQEFEIRLPDEVGAQALHGLISRLSAGPMATLLDRYFSQYSSPGQVHRLETVELDLGKLQADALESALLEQFEAALATQLPRILQAAERSSNADIQPVGHADLELIVFFLETGSLPWWADTRTAPLWENTLLDLILREPIRLREALKDLLQQPSVRKRLATQASPAGFEAVMRFLATVPGTEGWNLAETTILLSPLLAAATGRSEEQVRQLLRDCMLTWVRSFQEHTVDILVADLFQQIAKTFALPPGQLLALLNQAQVAANEKQSAFLRHLQAVPDPIASQLYERFPNETRLKKPGQDPGREAQTPKISDPDTDVPDHLGIEEERQRGEPSSKITPSETGDDPEMEAQRPMFSNAADDESMQIQKDDLLAGAAAIKPGDESYAGRVTPPHPAAPSHYPNTKKPDLKFSHADELFISNAGLVVLGPFLPHFFRAAGLIVENDWADEGAPHRGVGLLHYLISGQEEAPEHQTPLLKVVCGMQPEDPLEYPLPLEEALKEECVHFLESVVAHAPILNNMSPDGFRGTFLMRAGTLGRRDGHWLVRVERQAYDVVADRFPWSFRLITLPWLKSLIAVEW